MTACVICLFSLSVTKIIRRHLNRGERRPTLGVQAHTDGTPMAGHAPHELSTHGGTGFSTPPRMAATARHRRARKHDARSPPSAVSGERCECVTTLDGPRPRARAQRRRRGLRRALLTRGSTASASNGEYAESPALRVQRTRGATSVERSRSRAGGMQERGGRGHAHEAASPRIVHLRS